MKWPIGFNSPRYTQSKDLEKSYTNHQSRLASMKSNVDNKPPTMQRGSNAKSVKASKARQAKIHHDNLVLLKRMNDHFSRKSPSFSAPPYRMNRNTFSEHRIRMEKQIETDNQFILKRINENARISHYSREKMAKEEGKREKVLQIMCHFRGVPRSLSPTTIATFQKRPKSTPITSSKYVSSAKVGSSSREEFTSARPKTAPELRGNSQISSHSEMVRPKTGKSRSSATSRTLSSEGKENRDSVHGSKGDQVNQQERTPSRYNVVSAKSPPSSVSASQSTINSNSKGSRFPRPATAGPSRFQGRGISVERHYSAHHESHESSSTSRMINDGLIYYYKGETRSLVSVPSPYSGSLPIKEKTKSSLVKADF